MGRFGDAVTASFSCSNASVSDANGFCSNQCGDVSYNQLQKFWSDLLPRARLELLRIDKQALFEQARKNMYCSRCYGLLLEGFLQIVVYGKSLQQEVVGEHIPCNRIGPLQNENDGDVCMKSGCQDDVQDPSVYLWGGLTTARDGTLTLLDCYLYSKSLKGLQNVFDSACARERERELLYPDACGGGGRGWISQGMAGYGRGLGTREACALHTTRLSVDTLVDFWSALGEETWQSLLRMKEEDFIEKLMCRFDRKRFCRDCRRNVIREFKELKELNRMRREPCCTNWFCVADTAFQYEVSHDTVQADWHQTFNNTFATYHHFEWAVGTGKGKSDILDFENVGLSGRVQVNGLDLSGLNACYITLRAWGMDGRCTELSVKAHAFKGQQCVHCRLVASDGFVTITRGGSMRRFFEHAEEAEEEEDDDFMDKDKNELDVECSRDPSRPQKHAKSPELAREFLLDAATIIFKKQIEKAFREETTRQNAHNIFVCLALKLLEERVHVACKDIITLEKQMKLLEEEEKEKREEEERKERRKAKEREKKLRRKGRLREKEKGREKKYSESNQNLALSDVSKEESMPNVDDESSSISNVDSINETSEAAKSTTRSSCPKFGEKFHCSNNRMNDKYNFHARSCNQQNDCRAKVELHCSTARLAEDIKSVNNSASVSDMSRPYYRGNTYNQVEYMRESCGRPNNPSISGNNPCIRDSPNAKKVWEPLVSQKLYPRSNSESDVTLRSSSLKVEATKPNNLLESSVAISSAEITQSYIEISHEDIDSKEPGNISSGTDRNCQNRFNFDANSSQYLKNAADEEVEVCHMTSSSLIGNSDPSMSSTSSSDNCSSCLSEEDSNSTSQNPESTSTSDSEETTQHSVGREAPLCLQNVFHYHEVGMRSKQSIDRVEAFRSIMPDTAANNLSEKLRTKTAQDHDNGEIYVSIGPQPQGMLPPLYNQSINFSMFQAPCTMDYYQQSPVSWPADAVNGVMPFPHPNHYAYASPFGYCLNGNSKFMQDGDVHHLTRPQLNPGYVPLFQPVARTNRLDSKEYPKIFNLGGTKEAHHEAKMQKVVSTSQSRMEAPSNEEGSEKLQMSNMAGFSLFHFGGPVALLTEDKSNHVPSKRGIVTDISSNLSADQSDSDHACNKKDAMEEYNLFAASNGIKFPFF